MTYGTRGGDYPATSKWLHWLVAICVLTTAPVAIAMHSLEPGATQDALYFVHKSLGMLILLLMLLRLINRLVVGAPAPDPEIDPWQRLASSIVHTSLYVLLLAMPVVGYIRTRPMARRHRSSVCSKFRRSSARRKRWQRHCSRFTTGSAGW